jgi:L-fuculose-phosphate aldolase
MKEMGKTPSRAVGLHEKIYALNPEISAVLLAHPVNAMAFAVTDTEFDPRTIPESYILLRDVKRISYEEYYTEQEANADYFGEATPALMVENACVIVTGSTLLQAFDRLEVMESTAHSIINAAALGDIVHISKEEVEDLKKAFHLVD